MAGIVRAWRRYRKENRFLLTVFFVVLFLSGGAFSLFERTQEASSQELTNRLLLFVLWYLDVSLILVLSFIIIRSLVKLLLERRAGILGARFRTKLILTYIALTFVPVIFIFLIATNLLQHSIDRWFSSPVENILKGGRDLAVELRETIEERLQRQATIAASELEKHPTKTSLADLQRIMTVDLLALFDDDVLVEAVADPRKVPAPVPELHWSDLETQGVRVERWRGGLLIRAWTPVGSENQRLVVGAVLPSHLLIHLQRTTDADVQFQELKAQQGTVTATTILVFLSVTLLLLFSTVWIGLYLSRRFTAPLLAVVDATRRVAEGDALEEVVAPASDEVEVLVDSFNAMVRRVRATEQEILSSNHELATLLATIPTGVLTLSPDDASFRPNAAAAGMLGHQQWQRTWQPIENLETPGLEELWCYIDGGDPLRQRTEIDLTVGGETRHVEVSRRPLAGGGSVVAIDDLTELVAAQRQAAWSEVARRIAHEIKNPLTPIQLAAERVQRRVSTLGLEGDIEQILTSSCEAIVAHVSGLQDLVDSFHQYAQMPAVTLRPWSINRLVDETVALYEDFRQGVKITTRCLQETLWAMVDPVLLRQALVNLIDNAAAAIPGTGTIEVHVEREGDHAILEILDSGSGLPTDDVQVLTQPFFSTKGRGSGMGLAIVDRIVRDHGGVFEIGGRAEGGTRARIVLIGAVVPQPTAEQSRELSFSATNDTI